MTNIYRQPALITVFQGDELIVGSILDTIVDVATAPFKGAAEIVKATGEFTTNVIVTSGKAVQVVTSPITSVVGKVTDEIKKIPVIGSPIATVLSAGYQSGMGPVNLTVAITQGQRIDTAILGELKAQLKTFRQVAPYAQMVLSMVPGIGSGVSAALAAGIALAEGQSIDDALKAGLIAAIPGGPIVTAAVTMCVEIVSQVAQGKPITLESLFQTAAGVASSALAIPIVTRNIIMTAVSIGGDLAQGKPLNATMANSAINLLPVPDSTKNALNRAVTISDDLINGKSIDLRALSQVTLALPKDSPLRQNLEKAASEVTSSIDDTKKLALAAIHSGIGDELIQGVNIPTEVKQGFQAGLALGSGALVQGKLGAALNQVTGKLTETGIQAGKIFPPTRAARTIASSQGVTQGFDIATGLLQHQLDGLYPLVATRNALPTDQKVGFDMAAALHVGSVTNPNDPNLSDAANAGRAITLGMQGYSENAKMSIMQLLQTNQSATVGATVAVKEVAQRRMTFLDRIIEFFIHLFRKEPAEPALSSTPAPVVYYMPIGTPSGPTASSAFTPPTYYGPTAPVGTPSGPTSPNAYTPPTYLGPTRG